MTADGLSKLPSDLPVVVLILTYPPSFTESGAWPRARRRRWSKWRRRLQQRGPSRTSHRHSLLRNPVPLAVVAVLPGLRERPELRVEPLVQRTLSVWIPMQSDVEGGDYRVELPRSEERSHGYCQVKWNSRVLEAETVGGRM